MRVLITGGSGFVGHHVVEHFIRETDHEIVILDSLTYAGDVAKVLRPGFDPRRVSIVWHDLRAPIVDGTAEKIGRIDVILNLASASHVDTSITDPVPFVQNNVAVALNMLEFARKAEPFLFVQFSTDEVFGPAPQGKNFGEWCRHIPSNPYAASKSAQEAIAISYWRTYGVPLVITNTMNVFGERQHPEKFIPMAIAKLLAGDLVPVHAENVDGVWESGSRFWIYAGDVAYALAWLIAKGRPPSYPDVDRPSRFNLVGDKEVRNDLLAKRIGAELGMEAHLEYVDFHSARPGHDRRYALDGAKLREAGWEPVYGFDEGLKRTIASYT